ncbi:TrmB family transcriptional regulator [Halorussus caseinilyticus]|uniref:TrmB family transcriptional regulator n=1 Tax=Halorussus caseinilyticus TaxID=3034025 RepID=A0ABD5WGE1_9EURY
MDRDVLTQALEYADLTAYQVDAYLTLLEMGVSPAIEIGREGSVPVSQVYDVLRSLESKGYAETIEREKLYVRPCEPDSLIEDLESRGNCYRTPPRRSTTGTGSRSRWTPESESRSASRRRWRTRAT